MRAPVRRRRSFQPRMWPLLAASLIVAVFLLWLLPPLFDWQVHRAGIEAAASGFVGRDVSISGPIRVTLLPQPSVTAERVEVRNEGDGTHMSARGLTMSLSLGALLTGRLDVNHVTLDRPDITLPWPMPRGPLAIEPPPWLSSLSAEISHGHITIGPLAIVDASFTLATGGPAAALQVDGSGALAGRAWNFSLALAWPRQDGSAPLQMRADTASGSATSLHLKGAILADGSIAGPVTAHGDDLSALFPTPALPFDANGALTADRDGVRLEDLALILGSQAGNGSLNFRLPRTGTRAIAPITIGLHMPLIDLEPWAAALQQNPAPPLALKVSFDADAATLRGGLLRHLGLQFQTDGGRVRIDNASASLPGETAVTLAGFYDPKALAFLGKAQVTAAAPATTLHWLSQAKLLPDTAVIADGLDSLAVSGDLRLAPRQMVITGMTGLVNGTPVSGGLSVRNATPPSLSAALDFGKLDLGEWLPDSWSVGLPMPDTFAKSLKGIAADLRLSAQQAWLGDTAIHHALLDLSVANGRVVLRRIGGQVDGVQLVGSGAMDAAGRLDGVRLVVSAQPAGRLAQFAPARLRGAARFWSAPLLASLTANGPPDRLAVAIIGSIGDLALSAQPVVNLRTMSGHGPVAFRHPNADRLLRDLGFGDATAWLGEGSLSLITNAAVDGGTWTLSPLSFSLGLIHGHGQIGTLAGGAPDGRGVTGSVGIDTLPWPDPDPNEPIPTDLLRGWQARLHLDIDHVVDGLAPLASHVSADADVGDDALHVTVQNATVLDGRLSGTAKVEASVPPAVSMQLALTGAHLSAPIAELPILTASQLDATLAGSARGYSLGAWLSSLDGTVTLKTGEATLSGINLSALAGATPVSATAPGLSSGHTVFRTLEAAGAMTQGDLKLQRFDAQGPAGTLSGAGTVDLVRGICDLRVAVGAQPAEGTAPSPFDLLLQGALASPKRAVFQHSAP